MLWLPYGDRAYVPIEKARYLLDPQHPDNRGKALFFARFGFSLALPMILADALRAHGQQHPVARTLTRLGGTRYDIDGALSSPDGRNPQVRSGWYLEDESDHPRLVTAIRGPT